MRYLYASSAKCKIHLDFPPDALKRMKNVFEQNREPEKVHLLRVLDNTTGCGSQDNHGMYITLIGIEVTIDSWVVHQDLIQ